MGKTAVIDWILRVIKYSLLVGATFSMQHALFILAGIFVITAATCDYFAQTLLLRREID
jgi:hypothetical protein